MNTRQLTTCDGNKAAASVAHRLSEVIAIYPITPSSTMGELADEWSAKGQPNVWGTVPEVVEMQSEGGAAGAVHGALQAGALTTTFTASQGLLLMVPDMFKIAGELTSFCMHVSARTVATHALSIFGDHSDVMACRTTGFALLASSSVQEAHDLAAVGHAATLRARVPFLHFFDGFRTSHELNKIELLGDDDLLALLDADLVAAHRRRALTPDRPVLRGTAQNPDTFFQAREAANGFYDACPEHVQATMDAFQRLTGRAYRLFDYVGAPDAERVVVMMGSGAETTEETMRWLLRRGEKVGLLKVRLFRPFSLPHFLSALPKSVRALAVLDRTKEPGAVGEPLFLDVVTALAEAKATGLSAFAVDPVVVGGRYGLSSKEFTPAMAKAVYDELGAAAPRRRFTVGILDDVTRLSLPYDPEFDLEEADVYRAVFFGLGADGTVSANKSSVSIIGEETPNHAQAYFVYDSKKSGAVTISHLRFGPRPIRAPYLIRKADFVACHQFAFLEKLEMLDLAAPGATFLLNARHGPAEVWEHLPREVQAAIVEKRLRFFVIDAEALAKECGLGGRINTIMQVAFFALAKIIPLGEAVLKIQESIRASYGKRGEEMIRRNFAAVEKAPERLREVTGRDAVTAAEGRPPIVSADADAFTRHVTALMLAGRGDLLPVSAFPVDGTWATGTARWEKRNIATEIPVWDEAICIQCNKCAMVCPHAAIRVKVYEPGLRAAAPPTYKHAAYKGVEFKGLDYTVQVAPEDCTGCTLCMMVCPAKDKANPKHKALEMAPQPPLREAERANYAFFLDLPEVDRNAIRPDVKGVQFLEPLFEYSGACAGCGETPYVKLLTQLFGDRALIANATGCSSIYGGNLPTTPYAKNRDGRGPAWSNSLFEDNAEFGLGFRLALDRHEDQARRLVKELAAGLGETLADALLSADQSAESGIAAQRERVAALKGRLPALPGDAARRLEVLADYLVKKSVWIVGGDGWAYDIGYGGLDHVLAQGRDVNVLVLDTEVYSNTGGQQSKATPLGASAKFAMSGKKVPKKDLGMMAMAYGHVYVAHLAFGAKDAQTVKAFQEAEAWHGPSLLIAYSPCIAHGYDMAFSLEQQKKAVDSGYWPLYRFDPRRFAAGESPLALDSGAPKLRLSEFVRNETRFRMVEQQDAARFGELMKKSEREIASRYGVYEQIAKLRAPSAAPPPPAPEGKE